MTIISFEEIPDSREVKWDPPSVTTKWVCEGVFASADVADMIPTVTPAAAVHPLGTLYRGYPVVRELGHKLYEIVVPYDKTAPTDSGDMSLETSSINVHIQGKAGKHIQTYERGQGANYPSHDGLIGVKGADAEGIDIYLPATKLSVRYTHAQGAFNAQWIASVTRLRGAVDNAGFMGNDPYETYFLGFDGQEGTDVQTEVIYHFAIRKNQTDYEIGGVTVSDLKGWDVPWVKWKMAVSGGKPAPRVEYVNVVRIPHELPFASILGFG